MQNTKNVLIMLNQFTKVTVKVFQLFLLACFISVVLSCATPPKSKSDDGALSTRERLARIKETGTSKEPQKEAEQAQEEQTTEDADEAQTDESEPDDENLDDDEIVSTKPAQQTPSSQQSAYQPIHTQLPQAIKRTHPKTDVSRETQAEYKDALKALEKAVKTKDFAEALARFEQLSEKNQQISGPHTNIGMIYMHQQKFEDAEKAFLKALEINPENEFALNNIGLCYREMGKFQEAKQSYQKATALEPRYAEAHYNLGILAELYLHDLELAIQSFEYYLLASRKKDNEVETWLIDLQNRLATEKQLAAQAQANQQNIQPAATSPATESNTDSVVSEENIVDNDSQESEATTEESPSEQEQAVEVNP